MGGVADGRPLRSAWGALADGAAGHHGADVTPSETLAGYVHGEPGPGPALRAAVGFLLGAACGAFVLAVLPRVRGVADEAEGRVAKAG